MPYQQNIPLATDQGSQSQADLLGNFQAIFTLIDEDHYIFGDPNEGKHKRVMLPAQAVPPVTGVTEMAFFAGPSIYTGNTELGYRREGNGAIVDCTSSEPAIAGWTFLPSGILLKWGQATTTNAGPDTIAFPVAANIPAFNNVYNIQLTPLQPGAVDSDVAVRLVGYTAADFDVWGSYRTVASNIAMLFTYLAIGD